MQENGKGLRRKQGCGKPIRDSTNDKIQQELTNDGLQNPETRRFKGEKKPCRKEVDDR